MKTENEIKQMRKLVEQDLFHPESQQDVNVNKGQYQILSEVLGLCIHVECDAETEEGYHYCESHIPINYPPKLGQVF